MILLTAWLHTILLRVVLFYIFLGLRRLDFFCLSSQYKSYENGEVGGIATPWRLLISPVESSVVETASCKFFVNHRVSTTLVVAMESCPNYFLSSRYQESVGHCVREGGYRKVVGTLIALTFHCSHKKLIQTSHIVTTATFLTTYITTR